MDTNQHIHVFKDSIIPSTCKEKGYTLHKCDCGCEHKDNFRPLIDHSFQLSTDTAPSCTEPGTKTYVCSTCGETTSLTSAPSGHAWGDWNVQTFPTCTESGTQMRFCANCGTREDSDIPAKGHNLSSPKKSETEKGMLEYFCENCGEIIVLPEKEKKEKKKVSKKRIKGIIAAIFSILIIAGIVLSINPLLIPLYHYNTAKSEIKKGNYAEAYYHLQDCIDFRDSRSLLRKFTVAYESVETIYYDNDGKKIPVYKNKYDEHGNITSSVSYDRDGKATSETKYTYEYDDNGNMLKRTVINKDGITESVYEYEYFEATTSPAGDAIPITKTKIEYTYEYKFNEDGSKKQVETEKDGEAFSKTKYEYNDEGKLTKVTSYGEGGKITSKIKYEYDNDGNLVSEENYEGDELSYKTEYNANGREISNTSYYGDDSKIEYRYDDKGNFIFISQGDSDYFTELSFEYEYDKKDKILSITPEINCESEDDTDDLEIEVDFECDSNNNLSMLNFIIKGELDGDEVDSEYTIEYEYNENNTPQSNTIEISYDDNSSTSLVYEYDENGILTSYTTYDDDKKDTEYKYENPIILYNPETP